MENLYTRFIFLTSADRFRTMSVYQRITLNRNLAKFKKMKTPRRCRERLVGLLEGRSKRVTGSAADMRECCGDWAGSTFLNENQVMFLRLLLHLH